MSELLGNSKREKLRLRLLATVSALTVLGACGEAQAKAEDGEPAVWIELGGQLERIQGAGDRFTPAFTLAEPTPPSFKPVSPIKAQTPSRFSYGGEGKLSFEAGGDWVLSASIRYGRSNGKKHVHQQTRLAPRFATVNGVPNGAVNPAYAQLFADTNTDQHESHMILDFQAGKDVGLGMFGTTGDSTLNFGVRYAQFSARATALIRARPKITFYNGALLPHKYFPLVRFHAYTASIDAARSFHGLGPSLSWNASAKLAGDPEESEVTLDFGVAGALLFGRQKAHAPHESRDRYYRARYNNPDGIHAQYKTRYDNNIDTGSRSRSVMVPNIGGFAGLSFRRSNAKISFGYRGDFFLGAMDVGIDTRKSETMSFHGPFATLSIGFRNGP